MNKTTPETRSAIVEREFPHPPEKLWRALTQPRQGLHGPAYLG